MKTGRVRSNIGGIFAGCVAIAAVCAAEEAAADPVGSASLDIASAYVFRGVTLNDGLVAQPSLTVSPLPGLSLGVWGNLDLDDYGGKLNGGQFSEVDLTASYAFEIEKLQLTLGYAEYLYPGAGAEADREATLSLALPLPLAPTVSAYYGLGGAVEKNTYVELGVSHEIPIGEDLGLTLGAALGYAIPDDGDSGFSHYTAQASLGYKALALTATYYGQLNDKVLSDENYDQELVVALKLSMEF